MRKFPAIVAPAIALMLVCGCGSATPEPVESSSQFEGTPDEHALLTRECLEDNGVTTADLPAGDPETAGFAVAMDGLTNAELVEIVDRCRIKIGDPPIAGLSESELKARYEARVDQWDCLVEHGLLAGSPPSLDLFIADYNRSGQTRVWEPTDDIDPQVGAGRGQGATDICPRPGSVW